jgi:NADH:ubiquinone oxidoreductase subunit 3 (subunit A)
LERVVQITPIRQALVVRVAILFLAPLRLLVVEVAAVELLRAFLVLMVALVVALVAMERGQATRLQ